MPRISTRESMRARSIADGRRPSSSNGSRMLPSASSVGTRLNAWKMKPTRRRRRIVRSRSPRPVISVSPIHARPWVGVSRPAMMCMSVDLPEPEAPMIAVNWPRRMPTLTSSRARTAPSPDP
jgi:hypothetical protein